MRSPGTHALDDGRRGRRARILCAIAVAFGAAFWIVISFDENVDMPFIWIVSTVLVPLIPVVLLWPSLAVRLLFVLCVAAPVVAVLAMVSIYVFGDGISDGAGGTEPLGRMLPVAVAGAGLSFSAPAAAVASVLSAGRPRARPSAPGDS